jgi:hypothetical protein
MIFEINGNDLYRAIQDNTTLVCMSTAGERALVMGESINPDIMVYNQYADSAVTELLWEPTWRQPCKECEI